MKNFFKNTTKFISNDSWAIFCVFSKTNFIRYDTHNLNASIFFTDKFDFGINIDLIKSLHDRGNFDHLFIVSSQICVPESQKHSVNGKHFTVYASDLKELLKDGNLFKLTMNDNSKLINNSIFIFLDLKWKDICREFQNVDIVVSGGASSKRHMLSPIQVKLMFALTSFGYQYSDVVSSFNNIDKERCMPKDTLATIQKPLINDNVIASEKSLEENETCETNLHIDSNLFSGFNSSNVRSNNHINTNSSGIKNGDNGVFKGSGLSDINNDSRKKFSTFCVNYNLGPKGGTMISKDFSFYLDTLKEIIKNCEKDPHQAQKDLENSWLDILREKLLNSDMALQTKLPVIFKKSRETLDIAAGNGDLKRRFKSIYEDLNNDKFLLLTLGYILSQYTYNKRNNIAMNIGNNILYELFKLKKDKTNDFKSFKIEIGYYDENLGKDNVNKIGKLGVYFINIFMNEPTHIFDENFSSDVDNPFYNESDVSIVINPEYNSLIIDEFMLNPKSIPMICKPNLWGENLYGGFLENSEIKDSIISGSSHHKHVMNNKEFLYNTINYLNSIKFSINTDLLDYLNGEGNKLVDILNEKINQNFTIENSKSENIQRYITFRLAEIYRNVEFYLNVHSDWRGRIYTHSFFLSYQGGDLSSAIIQFSEGEALDETGLMYLYIYGANCYGINGLSKQPFDEKIKWVKDNLNIILNMDPLFISKADSPYLFTAFSLVLRKLKEDPKAIIKIPVFLDATCSGIQHLAALLTDFNLGNKVNLVPNENVNDIYAFLIEPINNNINRFGKENIEFNNLSDIKLTRNIIKQPIMTKVYNVSLMGIKDQLISKFKKVKIDEKTIRYEAPGKHGKILLNNQEIYKMATIINDTIFEQFPLLKTIYDYFLDIVKIMIILEIPITWFTPSGLQITQSYSQSKVHKVSISFKGKSKTMVLRDTINKLDKRKQVNAIIPNIIHSLDASHLINLINSAIKNNFTPIVTIHDCFGTHPNLMDKLAYEVKKEFILLYSNPNFLENFHNKIIQSIKDNNYTIIKEGKNNKVLVNKKVLTIPNCPKFGKLDLKNIINSKYMIC